MSTLHFIHSGPDSASFKNAIECVSETDNIVLFGEAVFASQILQKHPKKKQCLAIVEDVQARGIHCDLTQINYDDLVELVCRHSKQICWG